MEYMKDELAYTEIGGIYIKNDEVGEWKLLSTDADLSKLVNGASNGDHQNFYIDNVIDRRIEPLKMQPHVLVSPRQNLFAVFVKTRKRKPGREYKSDTAVMNYKLEKIEKAMAAPGDSNAVEELVCDGKSHGPSWLKGRYVKSAPVSTNAPTSTYVQEFIAQIKQNLVDEMEVKVNKKLQEEVDSKVNRKVQDNLTWVLKKLGEANPGMKIDLGELCVTISTDNENGTPMTGGTSR